jgi:putative oxidoreductase
MKHIPNVVGALLGLVFLFASLMILLNLAGEQPAPPEGSHAALFMGGFAPSGYLHFVKWCELIGGILVLIPKTRGLGLLVLGPIVVNIFAYHATVTDGVGLSDPMVLGVGVLTLLVAFFERTNLLRLAFKTGG